MIDEQSFETRALTSLRKAVAEALERKRRLGQYAVIWRDGRPQRIEPEMLGTLCSDTPPADDARQD